MILVFNLQEKEANGAMKIISFRGGNRE